MAAAARLLPRLGVACVPGLRPSGVGTALPLTSAQRWFGSINIFKEGEEPEIKPDEEYPEWLKALAYPKPTLEELEAMDVYEMNDVERKRYWRLHKRAKIRRQNELARISTL